MDNLYSLKLCVEKSISKSDNKLVKEAFGLPIEALSFIGIPGASFKKNTYPGENIPGTYTGGFFNPLPELKYEYEENFAGATSGVSSADGFDPHKGTDYGFSSLKGTEYGLSPYSGTEYGFSILPGIQNQIEQVKSQEIPEETIASFNRIMKIKLERLRVITIYLYTRFGPDVAKTIMQSPMIDGLKAQSLSPTSYGPGVQDMLDIVGTKVLDGYNIDSYNLGLVGGSDYVGTVYMTKSGNPDFTQSWNYGIPIPDSSQVVRGSLSIPTQPTSTSLTYSDNASNLYDFKKELSPEQLLEYQQQFEDIFGAISEEEQEEKQLEDVVRDYSKKQKEEQIEDVVRDYSKKQKEEKVEDIFKYSFEEEQKKQALEYKKHFEAIYGVIFEKEKDEEEESRKLGTEDYEPEYNQNEIMFQRIKNFIDQGIIVLTQPELGIAKSIIQRKFVVKKITISFGEEGTVKKTPLIELESVRDNDGNVVEIDPIEYKIRNLSPINAVKKVLRERIFPLVNLEFEFLDEKIQEDFDILQSGIVRIGFDPKGGCWSMLGMDNFFTKEKFTLNFAWLDAGTIMHEFCHFLGMIHEHQVPIGKTIQWDEPAVYNWARVVHGWTKEETYINIIKKYKVSQVNGIKYDPLSIMHYFFPPQLTKDKKGSRQNLRLAIEDIKFIIYIFPGKNINYKTFYKQIYGKNIEDDSNWLHNLLKILAGLTLIYILFRAYKKIKKNNSKNTSSFSV